MYRLTQTQPLTPSELQCWGSRLKGIRDIGRGTELSGIRVRAGEQLSPIEQRWQRPLFLSFLESSHYRTTRQTPYLRLHQSASHCLLHSGHSLRPCPTQHSGPPKLLKVAFPYEWHVLAHALDFPKFSQTNIWLQ